MGRKSTIAKLPDAVKDALNAYLRDTTLTQAEAAERTNALLEAMGLDYRISTSAVNRYSQRMEEVGERLRQSREVADMWIAKLGNQPQGKLGALTNEIVRTLAFEVSLLVQDSGIDADNAPEVVKMIRDLAIAQERLEKAATENEKRTVEIRKQAAAEAAEAMEKTAKSAGLKAETVRLIKSEILGIAL